MYSFSVPPQCPTAGPYKVRLDPSDPEYHRIQRDAASAFGDDTAPTKASAPPAVPASPPSASEALDLIDLVQLAMDDERDVTPSCVNEMLGKLPASADPQPVDLVDATAEAAGW